MRIAMMALAAAMVAGSAAAQPPDLSTAQSIELGRQLTARNCGMCHATARKGASPKPEAPPLRQLYLRMDVEILGEGLVQGILTRHPAMPEFRFEPHEAVAIVRYLRSIQDRQSAEAAPHRSAPGA